MALPQYKMNGDDVLEQADVTRERLDWLHSREVRSSEARDWADIFAEPVSSERALPDIRGRRGGNEPPSFVSWTMRVMRMCSRRMTLI